MHIPATRLAWRLRIEASGVELQPCEQTRGPDGHGRGRRLPLARLLAEQEQLDWLSGQDRLILRALAALQADIAADGHAALDALAALPLLVGHPALYWADAPEQPLRVEAGQVALELERQGEQISLRLSPPGIAACAGVLWRKLAPDRLAVYRLDEEVRQIAALLGHSLSLPWHARKKVLDAIRDIAPELPLHDVSASFDDSLPSQPADAVLRALLRLDETGLRLQLKVRPHPASALYAPGRGAPGLVVSVDGVALQLKRDLAAERARQRQVHA
ncbi:ATP-dependent helicase, partial [Chromobacterium aquaticum]|nr:ATP-dependent helicase [Chromobacterium aquaticum]